MLPIFYSIPLNSLLSAAEIPAAKAHFYKLWSNSCKVAGILCAVCRSQAALDDFRKGLNVVGLLPHMVAMPEAFKPLFCTAPHPLTRSQLHSLFVVQWSEVGTNFREQEEDTVYAFLFWLGSTKKI